MIASNVTFAEPELQGEIKSGAGTRYHTFSSLQFANRAAYDKYATDTGILQDSGVPDMSTADAPGRTRLTRRGSMAGMAINEDDSVSAWRFSSLATSRSLDQAGPDQAAAHYQAQLAGLSLRPDAPVSAQSANAVLSDFGVVERDGKGHKLAQATHAQGVSGVGREKADNDPQWYQPTRDYHNQQFPAKKQGAISEQKAKIERMEKAAAAAALKPSSAAASAKPDKRKRASRSVKKDAAAALDPAALAAASAASAKPNKVARSTKKSATASAAMRKPKKVGLEGAQEALQAHEDHLARFQANGTDDPIHIDTKANHSEGMALLLHNRERAKLGLPPLAEQNKVVGMVSSIPNNGCPNCVGTFGSETGDGQLVSVMAGLPFQQHEGLVGNAAGGVYRSNTGNELRGVEAPDVKNANYAAGPASAQALATKNALEVRHIFDYVKANKLAAAQAAAAVAL